jgi:hypothetical protein
MLAVLERIAGSLNSIKDDIRYLRNQEADRDAKSRRTETGLPAPVKVRPTRSDSYDDRYADFDVFTGK